jgi:hypothetical protein
MHGIERHTSSKSLDRIDSVPSKQRAMQIQIHQSFSYYFICLGRMNSLHFFHRRFPHTYFYSAGISQQKCSLYINRVGIFSFQQLNE